MIRIISREQIRAKTERFMDTQFPTLAGDHLILVEVGLRCFYDQLHILRAIHLSEEQLSGDRFASVARSRLPLGSEIVLYGENAEDPRPWLAANALSELGFTQLFVYEGGKADWLEDQLWVDVTLTPADGFVAYGIAQEAAAAPVIPMPTEVGPGKTEKVA